MNERQFAAHQARQLAQRNSSAVLSTLSKKLGGFPFGSVSPVMLTEHGDILFYVSDIAQHARNLDEDNRLSVTLFDSADAGDQNTQGRLTLSGRAQRVDDCDLAARYFQRFPDAAQYKSAHDFFFWYMEVEHIRFIGGFGEIFWLTPNEWRLVKPEWNGADALRMVDHMNEDHRDACALILQQEIQGKPIDPEQVLMASIYPEGFHLTYQKRTYFVSFPSLAAKASDVRSQLIEMTYIARSA